LTFGLARLFVRKGEAVAIRTIPSQADGEEVAAKGRAKAEKPFSPPELGLRPGSFGIADRLYRHVKEKRNSWQPKNVYASGLKNCARSQMLGIAGFTPAESDKQQENPQWNVVADFGSALHELVEKWLKELGISVKSEYRVKYAVEGKSVVTGRVDHRVRVDHIELDQPEDSVLTAKITRQSREAILDVKTVGSKDFKQGAHSPKMPGYVAQLSVYCHLEGVKTAIILLVNRDSGELMELEFDYDPEYAEKMLRRAKGIVDWATANRLPPAEEWAGSDGSFGCKAFCPFYRQCKREQDTLGQYTDDQGREIGEVQMLLYSGADPKTL
jgi:hypothetical protein